MESKSRSPSFSAPKPKTPARWPSGTRASPQSCGSHARTTPSPTGASIRESPVSVGLTTTTPGTTLIRSCGSCANSGMPAKAPRPTGPRCAGWPATKPRCFSIEPGPGSRGNNHPNSSPRNLLSPENPLNPRRPGPQRQPKAQLTSSQKNTAGVAFKASALMSLAGFSNQSLHNMVSLKHRCIYPCKYIYTQVLTKTLVLSCSVMGIWG